MIQTFWPGEKKRGGTPHQMTGRVIETRGVNDRPCFAVGWDGHTPLEIPPGATTHKTMEELLGVEKLPWWWAKEGRGRGVCPLAALTTL